MASLAQARLGENVAQLTRRFGQPNRAESTPNGTIECNFHVRNGDFDVQVTLRNGSSVAETYFSTQPLQQNSEPPIEIVRGIFRTNVPHARWLDRPTQGGHEDAGFVTADGRYGAWISNNGSWYNPGCTFVVSVYRADAGSPVGAGQSVPAAVQPPPPPSPTPTPLDPAVRAKLTAGFHAEIIELLAKAVDQPWLKTHPDSLDKISVLPPALADAVSKTADDARELRRKLGYDESNLVQYKDDTAVVDALTAFAEMANEVRSGNAVKGSEATDSFHQEYPAVPGTQSKSLWEAMDAFRKLLDRLHEDANALVAKASALSDAGKKGSAVQEYQKAYTIFPDPAVAEQIKRLREESLGL